MVNLAGMLLPQAGRMNETPAPAPETSTDHSLDRRREQRTALKSRHAQSLTRLMDTRTDLRGVHALADFVDDAVRWTA